MRIDHPTIGEYLQPTRSKAADGGIQRAAAAAITLPTISGEVPRQLHRQGGERAIGLIGGWLVESNLLPLSLWNPQQPVESIRAAMKAALTAAGTERDMLHVEFGQEVTRFYLPECASGSDHTDDASTVYFGVSNLFQDVFHAPKLMQLCAESPKNAQAINGLLQIALDDTVGGFGPARAWSAAEYRYWCGEVTGTAKTAAEDDELVRQMIEDEMTGEDTPLPSQLAEDIPYCLHFCHTPRRLDATARIDPAVASAHSKLACAYRKLNRTGGRKPGENKPVSAWGFRGETNYDAENYIIWTPSHRDADTNYTVALFDDHMNDLMNCGTSCSLMGLAQISNAKQFAEWLESVRRGCNVVDAALDLLETLA